MPTKKKWGFGIEKETTLIGYNNPLKEFSHRTSGAPFAGHNAPRGTPQGVFAELSAEDA